MNKLLGAAAEDSWDSLLVAGLLTAPGAGAQTWHFTNDVASAPIQTDPGVSITMG